MKHPALPISAVVLTAVLGMAAGSALAEGEDSFLNVLEGMGLETTPDSEAFLRTATGEPAPLKDWSEMNRYERENEEIFLSVMRHYALTLDEVTPLTDSGSVPVANCAAFQSEGMKANISKRGSDEYRNKADIYSVLAPLHALHSQDCTCSGKTSPWEPVELIYSELQASFGPLVAADTGAFYEEADRLRAMVEKMCGGAY